MRVGLVKVGGSNYQRICPCTDKGIDEMSFAPPVYPLACDALPSLEGKPIDQLKPARAF